VCLIVTLELVHTNGTLHSRLISVASLIQSLFFLSRVVQSVPPGNSSLIFPYAGCCPIAKDSIHLFNTIPSSISVVLRSIASPWSVCPNVEPSFTTTLSSLLFRLLHERRTANSYGLHPHPKNLVYTRRHPCRKSVNIDIAHHPAPATRPENAKMKTAKTIGNDRRRRPRRNAGNRPPYPSHPSRPRKVTIEPCRSTRRGRRPNSWRTRRSCGGTRGP